MERCPNCRARYAGGNECRRCGMDLALLLQIETRTRAWEQIAVCHIAQNDLPKAERALGHALRLHKSVMVRALLGFVRRR